MDVSEEAVIGENVQFTMTVTADNDYTMNGNFTMPIGLILENFENGDFSQMAWEFSGNQPWAISADAYEGEYAAKSGTISHSQASTIFIEMDITSDAVISFGKSIFRKQL